MKTWFSDFHSHTTYCDGMFTPEQMILQAISMGCTALGFSGHSYALFDVPGCMSESGTVEYTHEIRALEEKYAGEIEIFLGIEQDLYSDAPPEGLDYIIGSVHYINVNGRFVSVDYGANSQRRAVDTYFSGDYYAFAEAYFAAAAEIPEKTGADIIGHFDLITKYNEEGSLFDEMNPRYLDAAIAAMERILEKHRLFEVNTGAMYRLGKPEPYPSIYLLKELQKRGGEVILSGDCHDGNSICYKFAETAELLKHCGFTYVKRLTKNGFIDVKL